MVNRLLSACDTIRIWCSAKATRLRKLVRAGGCGLPRSAGPTQAGCTGCPWAGRRRPWSNLACTVATKSGVGGHGHLLGQPAACDMPAQAIDFGQRRAEAGLLQEGEMRCTAPAGRCAGGLGAGIGEAQRAIAVQRPGAGAGAHAVESSLALRHRPNNVPAPVGTSVVPCALMYWTNRLRSSPLAVRSFKNARSTRLPATRRGAANT